jgi:hypothetical protein
MAVFHNNEAGLATYFLQFEKFNGFLHPSSLAIFQQNPRHYLADRTKLLKAFFKKP